MRKTIGALLAFLLMLPAVSEAGELKSYSKSTPNFSLRYPAEWKLTEQASPLKLRWEIPSVESDVSPAVIFLSVEDFSKTPSNPVLADYVEEKIMGAWDLLTNLSKIDETTIFVRRYQVQQNLFTATKDGDPLRIRSLVFIVDRVGYTLVYAAPPGSFGGHSEGFMSLAKSLRFGNESRFD